MGILLASQKTRWRKLQFLLLLQEAWIVNIGLLQVPSIPSTSTVLGVVCNSASSIYPATLQERFVPPPPSVFSWPLEFQPAESSCRSVILCVWSGGVSWAPAVVDENILNNAEFCPGLVRGMSVEPLAPASLWLQEKY